MTFGLSIGAFTILHVIISLVAILSGLIVFAGLLASERQTNWTTLFLVTTVLTTVTGFMFPFTGPTPAFITGIISTVTLALALLALYVFRLARAWRWVYVVTALFALYLNCFVLVVQSFLKIAVLHSLAPTQAELPFVASQGLLLVAFLIFGFLAVRRFHPMTAARA
jgi:hypothetical protein